MSSVTDGGGRGLDRLLHAVSTVRIPDEVRTVFNAEPGDPKPGQLWRARWDDVTELVLVTNVTTTEVTAVSVSLDDRFVDQDSVVLTADQTSLGTTVVVWLGLARQLPVWVLDRQVGAITVTSTGPDWVENAVVAGAVCGREPVGQADSVHEVRAVLVDTMGFLARAVWAPSGTGELSALLVSSSVSPQQLIGLLGVSPQRAMALGRGLAAATADDAVILAPVLGITDRAVLQANPAPPGNLVQRMSRPRRRAQIARLAAQRGIDERSAWLTATYAIGAQAARQTGGDTEPAWDERIDRYFQVTLES